MYIIKFKETFHNGHIETWDAKGVDRPAAEAEAVRVMKTEMVEEDADSFDTIEDGIEQLRDNLLDLVVTYPEDDLSLRNSDASDEMKNAIASIKKAEECLRRLKWPGQHSRQVDVAYIRINLAEKACHSAVTALVAAETNNGRTSIAKITL